MNLRRCQRYYQQVTSAIGPNANTTTGRGFGNLVPEMRASPSYSATDVLGITDGYSADFAQSSSNIGLIATDGKSFFIAYGNFSGLTTGRTMFFPRLIQAGEIYADAEL